MISRTGTNGRRVGRTRPERQGLHGLGYRVRCTGSGRRITGLRRVVIGDLETPKAFDALDGETFDVVLALDVLEHLREPTPVLRRAVTHLAPKGIAVVRSRMSRTVRCA